MAESTPSAVDLVLSCGFYGSSSIIQFAVGATQVAAFPRETLRSSDRQLPRDAEYSLAPSLVSRIATALPGFPRPVRLRFDRSAEELQSAPWERLLARLDRPLLRSTGSLLRPWRSNRPRVLLLCADDGRDRNPRAVVELARTWQRAADVATVQVFCGPAVFRELRRSPGIDQLMHLRSPYASGAGSPAIEGLTDPWLSWLAGRLEPDQRGDGLGADVVQIVAPGALVGGRGGMALLDLPGEQTRFRRIVGADEIAALATGLGAWTVDLVAPSRTSSLPALRRLGADLIQRWSGQVAVRFVDEESPRLRTGLGQLAGPAAPALLPEVTQWVPDSLPVGDPTAFAVTGEQQTRLLGEVTRDRLITGTAPRWLAAGSRVVENAQARAIREAGGRQLPDEDRFALGVAADILERHSGEEQASATEQAVLT